MYESEQRAISAGSITDEIIYIYYLINCTLASFD